MPYKFETKKIKIKKIDDKRIKLTDSEREEIKLAYGKVSQRKLAKAYGVSRRLIQFIGDPDKYVENLKRREERGGWQQYYDKNKNNKYMKKYRKSKFQLYKNNRLEEQNEKM